VAKEQEICEILLDLVKTDKVEVKFNWGIDSRDLQVTIVDNVVISTENSIFSSNFAIKGFNSPEGFHWNRSSVVVELPISNRLRKELHKEFKLNYKRWQENRKKARESKYSQAQQQIIDIVYEALKNRD
jgi:hypothetical protein